MPLPALGSMGFAPKAALWIIATAGGALLGAAATAYWNRGQPDVRVEDVSITDLYNGRFQAASQIQVPSDDIMTKLRSHKWTNGIRQSSLPISDFIQNLRDDERRLTDLLQSLERYRASRDQIRLTLDQPTSKETAERLFEAWEPNDDFLWGAIRGEYRRGTYVLPRKFTDAENAEWYGNEPLLRLRELITEEGAPVYTVTIPGGLYASALLPEDGDDFVLNKVAAYALAYFDKETLSTFIEVIDDELRNIDTHRNVRDEVRKMIDRFSRWSFAITAVNNGIQPLAFSGSATVLIDTRNVNQFGSEILAIEAENRDENGELAPVSIQGGEAKIIRYTSVKLVGDDPRWEQIIKMLESGDKEMVFLVEAYPKETFQEEVVRSSPQRFRKAVGARQLAREASEEFF